MDGPVSTALRSALCDILLAGRPDEVVSGMALGFDMIWAEEALELEIPVTAAIPFEGQERTWPRASQARYHEILAHPLVTEMICAPGGATSVNHKFDHRNRIMCDRAKASMSGRLIAGWDGTGGGTRNTVLYARDIELPIIRVRPTTISRLTWIVEHET